MQVYSDSTGREGSAGWRRSHTQAWYQLLPVRRPCPAFGHHCRSGSRSLLLAQAFRLLTLLHIPYPPSSAERSFTNPGIYTQLEHSWLADTGKQGFVGRGSEEHCSWLVVPVAMEARQQQGWAVAISPLSRSAVQLHPVLQSVPALISEVYVLSYFLSFDPPRQAGSHLSQGWGQPRDLPQIASLRLKATSPGTCWLFPLFSHRHTLLLVHGIRLQKYTKAT